ncbi:hypothetical protein BU198_04660 [Streptomyces sp. CBMA156]|nr:hypothetical protein [Streptomyces sp. CBMA156]
MLRRAADAPYAAGLRHPDPQVGTNGIDRRVHIGHEREYRVDGSLRVGLHRGQGFQFDERGQVIPPRLLLLAVNVPTGEHFQRAQRQSVVGPSSRDQDTAL